MQSCRGGWEHKRQARVCVTLSAEAPFPLRGGPLYLLCSPTVYFPWRGGYPSWLNGIGGQAQVAEAIGKGAGLWRLCSPTVYFPWRGEYPSWLNGIGGPTQMRRGACACILIALPLLAEALRRGAPLEHAESSGAAASTPAGMPSSGSPEPCARPGRASREELVVETKVATAWAVAEATSAGALPPHPSPLPFPPRTRLCFQGPQSDPL